VLGGGASSSRALRRLLAERHARHLAVVPARVDCLRPKMRHCLEEASSARAPDGSRGDFHCKIEIYLIHIFGNHLWLIDLMILAGTN
jgi:hypothetical protein